MKPSPKKGRRSFTWLISDWVTPESREVPGTESREAPAFESREVPGKRPGGVWVEDCVGSGKWVGSSIKAEMM